MKSLNLSTRREVKWLFSIALQAGLSLLLLCLLSPSRAHAAIDAQSDAAEPASGPKPAQVPTVVERPTLLFCLGDSLSHGTLDATNNSINTVNAYLQKVADSLSQVIPLYFSQPLFDEHEKRLSPFRVPSNLAVDGSDIFSLMGLKYYKRVGARVSRLSQDLLADEDWPRQLKDKYDKVLYPINRLVGRAVSQLGSSVWTLRDAAPGAGMQRALGIIWIGNNDSGSAALGGGGENPQYQPLPFDVVESELKPCLRELMAFGERTGAVSFEPYTQAAIERNLTEANDFEEQYERIVSTLDRVASLSPVVTDLFLLTFPYYNAVGYLMDSEDLEFYLQKVNPGYAVPSTFKRVAPPGEPITDPTKGDRIALVSFGMMYALLSTGYSVDDVNRVLEIDGQQRDGMVLSEEEQAFIMSRIDDFNVAVRNAAASRNAAVHLIDIGQHLNDAFTGKIEIVVGGRLLSRKWVRGSGFCLDGVHPSYTGHGLIANFVLDELNATLGLNAPLYDLSEITQVDPYIDQDGDGWAPGPQYGVRGTARLLFLFKDGDDSNPEVQAEMPPDVWDVVSDALLQEILRIPAIRDEAERRGIAPQDE
jgi:lysophospholipase L1-like esterase